MRPTTEQPTLFELHPLGTEPPIADRKITPGCLLPRPSKYFIDIPRVTSILQIQHTLAFKLARTRTIKGIQIGNNGTWRVDYSSVVEFCERLRAKHGIPDRRPPIRPGARWRDADILPFPITDTVSVNDVMIGLDISRVKVHMLIQEGAFEAYRFFEGAPWRISKTSLFEYAKRKRLEFEGQK